MALTAEQILGADDLPRVRVDVPEWTPPGGKPEDSFVFVRRMTGEEMDEYEDALRKNTDGGDELVSHKGLRLAVAVLTTCDDSGARLFTTAQMQALGAKSGEAIKRIFSASSDLNCLGKDATEKLEKN